MSERNTIVRMEEEKKILKDIFRMVQGKLGKDILGVHPASMT